jgi:hypothetical protein
MQPAETRNVTVPQGESPPTAWYLKDAISWSSPCPSHYEESEWRKDQCK